MIAIINLLKDVSMLYRASFCHLTVLSIVCSLSMPKEKVRNCPVNRLYVTGCSNESSGAIGLSKSSNFEVQIKTPPRSNGEWYSMKLFYK